MTDVKMVFISVIKERYEHVLCKERSRVVISMEDNVTNVKIWLTLTEELISTGNV